jgi:hypothetical protein
MIDVTAIRPLSVDKETLDAVEGQYPRALEALHGVVLKLMEERQFPEAQSLLKKLFAFGDRSPTMLLAYALSLVETGEVQTAMPIIGLLERLVLPEPLISTLHQALRKIKERIPRGSSQGQGAYTVKES